ncbi:hypothetical protein [Paenibacillus glufosinatiresistens]|uniref:hypothetical protein n=1 Tax=Paenibacillus glufosinatiresistens TaxID=3070657 RepID=UPI00286DE12F|nr:hypothetical protein [Paenibacillus sp. YX.27]
MNLNHITPGLRVRITAGHWTGRTGSIVAVGTFEGGPMQIGVLVDIGEPLLIHELPEHLELAPEEPMPSGWAEYAL